MARNSFHTSKTRAIRASPTSPTSPISYIPFWPAFFVEICARLRSYADVFERLLAVFYPATASGVFILADVGSDSIVNT